jgi:hypothetical protein
MRARIITFLRRTAVILCFGWIAWLVADQDGWIPAEIDRLLGIHYFNGPWFEIWGLTWEKDRLLFNYRYSCQKYPVSTIFCSTGSNLQCRFWDAAGQELPCATAPIGLCGQVSKGQTWVVVPPGAKHMEVQFKFDDDDFRVKVKLPSRGWWGETSEAVTPEGSSADDSAPSER